MCLKTLMLFLKQRHKTCAIDIMQRHKGIARLQPFCIVHKELSMTLNIVRDTYRRFLEAQAELTRLLWDATIPDSAIRFASLKVIACEDRLIEAQAAYENDDHDYHRQKKRLDKGRISDKERESAASAFYRGVNGRYFEQLQTVGPCSTGSTANTDRLDNDSTDCDGEAGVTV